MKKYIIVLSGLLVLSNCSYQNATKKSNEISSNKPIETEVESVSLSESTRGTQRIYTLTKDKLEISLNGIISNETLTKDEWSTIMNKIDQIKIESLSTYEAPTSKRFSDAAFTSVLNIKKNGENFESLGFDSGNPPGELKELYNELKNIIDKKKSK